MAQLSKVLKVVCWAGSVPFPPVSLQRQVVCLLLQPVFMFSSGESLHCFLVGWCTNKSYVILIATSDLWLFTHTSNLLPLNSPPTPLHEKNKTNKKTYLLLRILAVIGRFGPHLMIVMIFVTQNNFKNGPGISDRLLAFYQ